MAYNAGVNGTAKTATVLGDPSVAGRKITVHAGATLTTESSSRGIDVFGGADAHPEFTIVADGGTIATSSNQLTTYGDIELKNGAVFVDAGNIWTIHEYRDQPGGCFYFDEFYKQIAVSYGIGLRMALDFFTLRFDGGFKAIDPAYTGRRHYPITHHNLKNDFAFHFAVGLPF